MFGPRWRKAILRARVPGHSSVIPAARSCFPRRHRPSLPLMLLTGLLALVPMAETSPPDPLWIGGVYDPEDLDEVLVAATSLLAARRPILLVARVAGPVPAGDRECFPPEATLVPQSPSNSARLTRSPPSA